MARVLSLINGIPRGINEAGTSPIYDETIEIVASSPGAGQSLPINSGTPITLPSSQEYDGQELQIFHNGNYLDDVIDYTLTSSTEITMTFDLIAGDKLRFRIDRIPEP